MEVQVLSRAQRYTMKTNIYIDGNNLYRAAKEFGFQLDYKKFRGWLRQKYNPEQVYLFIAPDEHKCSFLIRNKNCEITFLNDHYHKFSKEVIIKEKTPNADVSA
jgi:hypothetical protein